MTTPYVPHYIVGDWVVRRPGTLGNMDGTARAGRVKAIFESHGHTMATVRFGDRSETFVAHTYMKRMP